jgi:hypothetical protein
MGFCETSGKFPAWSVVATRRGEAIDARIEQGDGGFRRIN